MEKTLIHHHSWFIWLFEVTLPTLLLVTALRSDASLHSVEAMLREGTPVPATAAAATITSEQPGRPAVAPDLADTIRIINVTPISATEVRLSAEGASLPPRRVFAAVRSPNSDVRIVKAEAFDEGAGIWSATVRLNNAGCRAVGGEKPPTQLTYLLSLMATSDAVRINDRQSVTGASEVKWNLPCG